MISIFLVAKQLYNSLYVNTFQCHSVRVIYEKAVSYVHRTLHDPASVQTDEHLHKHCTLSLNFFYTFLFLMDLL